MAPPSGLNWLMTLTQCVHLQLQRYSASVAVTWIYERTDVKRKNKYISYESCICSDFNFYNFNDHANNITREILIRGSDITVSQHMTRK